MDYEILLNGLNNIDEFLQELIQFLNYKTKTDILKREDYIALTNNFFTIIIDTDEIIGLVVIKEEFNFDVDISFNIQVFHKTLQEGLKILFELISFLGEDNKVLLLEGGSEVLRKVGDGFEISPNKKEESYFPFYLLKSNS